VHQGGVADPCIVSWPARVADAGAVRHQFAHAVDVLPTVLELLGIEAPDVIDGVEQSRIDGTSFGYLLGHDGADAPARHVTQHFEMLGSRAIYHDGWKAVTYHPVGPLYDDGLDMNASFDDDVWELYHVAEDPSECHDLATQHPDKVKELVELWWQEAERNDVLPLDNRVLWTILHPKPGKSRDRQEFRYFQNGSMVPQSVAADLRNRSHAITVDIEVADDGGPPGGVLIAMGSVLGGWSLHVLDGRPRYVHNLYGKERYVVAGADALDRGRHTITFAFEKDDSAGGRGTLTVDGATVAAEQLPAFTPSAYNGVGIGLTCGYEWGPAVGEGYAAPFPFTGTITKAIIEVTGPVVRDPLAELAAILLEQ
jgi:arylsulfatase